MAKIHVGKAMLTNRSLEEALAMSRPGDELLIHEGHHRAGSIDVYGIHLTGVGDPERVVVEGQINVWGESRFRALTLRAAHFHNAINLRQQGARADLTEVTVHAEPVGKYPAVHGRSATLVVASSTFHSPAGGRSIDLSEQSVLHVTRSSVAGIFLRGGSAVLADVQATELEGGDRASVEAYGRLDISPPADRRFLVLSGESAFTAPSLRVTDAPCEAYVQDSFVKIDVATAPEGSDLRIIAEGDSVVETTSDRVEVIDPNAPKVVRWHLSDADAFQTAIAPHVNAGDTVQLEEGDYFLEDTTDHALGVAVHLVGAGAGRTVIHGRIYVMEDHEASIRDLTIRAPQDANGITLRTGRSLTMTDVVVEGSGTTFPPVFLGGGTTTMTDCTVVAAADSRQGVLTVTDGARLRATGSDLGWLWLDKASRVSLVDSTSKQLQLLGGSTLSSRGSHLVEDNTAGQRQVVVQDGASASLESVTTDAVDFEAYVGAASLDIGWLQARDESPVRVFLEDGGSARVEGHEVTITDLDAVAHGTASAGAGPAPETGPSAGPDGDAALTPEVTAEGTREDGSHTADPLAEIDALTGLTTVKQQIRRFTRMVRYNQLRAQEGKPTTTLVMHSLFLGNPGTGKTTVARLLGQALHRAGAIPSDTFVEVTGRADLVGDTIGSSARLTTAVLESALGGVLFIDEAYTLYKSDSNQFAEEAVDTILTFMENHRDEIVVIFAGYGEQMQDLLGMNPGLRSRVTNRFDFEDFTPAEVAEIGYQELVDGDHTVDEQLYRRVVATEYGRTTDRSNGRWVRNFNQELITTLAERVLDAPGEVDISHITDADLHAVTGGTSEDKEARVEELLAELDALVGLDPVKEWVRRLVNRVVVDRRRKERDGTSSRPTYHMVFAGNPGTGKTTVARIVAELFHNLGILATPTVKEVNRDQLIGQYIGHTEANTTRALDEAMGGVFFLDEAYELLGEEGSRDFGAQVISTLLPRLENDRDKFVAIFAGYSQQMTDFLAANPGLRSRVPQWIEFPDYSSEEVARIVVARLARSWTFDEEHLAEVVARAYDETPPQDRSNGRWARIFVERLEDEHNDYVATHDIDGDDLDVIPAEVIDALAPRPRD
ncbi:MAG TPA: AAA family ATPase [Candidatus Janibacter merdipullorum]|nr:AAA family ATPase [Candidatus Janibacter merdipullorum]